MLYGPPGRESLVSEQFNDMCVRYRVEARIEPFPNPGDPYRPMRRIHFRSFNERTVFVYQLLAGKIDKNRQPVEKKVTLPIKGECDILIGPNDPMPRLDYE